MCDTFYTRRTDGTGMTAFFAKNSDRDPNEPQYMFFVPAGEASKPKTYVEMPSYDVKHDVWLSKPSWMWGAEMGVNRRGVSIGNEATFNKASVDKTGVLGMDHLRAALEIASTAREALETIIENTEHYGQGGDGGFEHPLYYHNSYLITDPQEAYVLDTVNRYYAYKKLDRNYNISNKISLKDDFDEISPELQGKARNFEGRFTNPIVSYFAGAYHRETRGRELMQRGYHDPAGVMSLLQDRYTGRIASMRNIGMIAGGLVSSQATASLFYDYDTELIWYTEGPCPEIQLFKPLKFKYRKSYDQGTGTGPCSTAMPQTNDSFRQARDENEGIKRWKYNNLLFRAVLKDYDTNKERLHPVLTEYQNQLFRLADETNGEELCRQAQAINREYIGRALRLAGEGPLKAGMRFTRYWSKENEALVEKEDDGELKELYTRYLR